MEDEVDVLGGLQRLVQGDDVATWRFGPGERPDQGNTITAIVEATSGDPAQTLRCEVDILLTDRPEASAGESRGIRNMQAAFLLRGQAAPAGYGMYSYLLLRTPFDDAEARRNIQATAMYLQAMWATARLRLSIAENQLNLVLLPLQRSVAMPTELMRPDEALAMATEVVKFYDYAHAQVLLSDFCITASAGGPYLVASPERGGCRRNRVLLDLTKAEPYLLPYWIRTFLSLAAAERSWANDTMTLLLLNTRNVIASSYGGAATAAQGLSQSLLMLDARR